MLSVLRLYRGNDRMINKYGAVCGTRIHGGNWRPTPIPLYPPQISHNLVSNSGHRCGKLTLLAANDIYVFLEQGWDNDDDDNCQPNLPVALQYVHKVSPPHTSYLWVWDDKIFDNFLWTLHAEEAKFETSEVLKVPSMCSVLKAVSFSNIPRQDIGRRDLRQERSYARQRQLTWR